MLRPHYIPIIIATLRTLPHSVRAAIGSIADLRIVNRNIAPDGFDRPCVLPLRDNHNHTLLKPILFISAVLAGGMFPGPVIRAMKSETFELNVFNDLTDPRMDTATSIVSLIVKSGMMRLRKTCMRGSIGTASTSALPLGQTGLPSLHSAP